MSLFAEPERWKLLHHSEDPDADYSYDDLALMERDDGLLALVRTSGCSCPDPDETWGVVAEGGRADVLKEIDRERNEWRDGMYRGPFIGMAEYTRAWREVGGGT